MSEQGSFTFNNDSFSEIGVPHVVDVVSIHESTPEPEYEVVPPAQQALLLAGDVAQIQQSVAALLDPEEVNSPQWTEVSKKSFGQDGAVARGGFFTIPHYPPPGVEYTCEQLKTLVMSFYEIMCKVVNTLKKATAAGKGMLQYAACVEKHADGVHNHVHIAIQVANVTQWTVSKDLIKAFHDFTQSELHAVGHYQALVSFDRAAKYLDKGPVVNSNGERLYIVQHSRHDNGKNNYDQANGEVCQCFATKDYRRLMQLVPITQVHNAQKGYQIYENMRVSSGTHLDKQVYLLYGDPSTGKTAFAKQMCINAGIDLANVVVRTYSSDYWDGITNTTEAVILEDLPDNKWEQGSFQIFKNLLDQYSCQLNVKGGFVACAARMVILTSNFDLQSIMSKLVADRVVQMSLTDPNYIAMRRRFTEIRHAVSTDFATQVGDQLVFRYRVEVRNQVTYTVKPVIGQEVPFEGDE